jgi:hypothetical protein
MEVDYVDNLNNKIEEDKMIFSRILKNSEVDMPLKLYGQGIAEGGKGSEFDRVLLTRAPTDKEITK